MPNARARLTALYEKVAVPKVEQAMQKCHGAWFQQSIDLLSATIYIILLYELGRDDRGELLAMLHF